VRRNRSQIFAGVPDLQAEVVRETLDGKTAWIEWEMRGRRLDGTQHLMRGVTVFGKRDGRFGWVRFYLEPVDVGGSAIDAAVREHLAR
jgi:hypothetical protein